ncbi:Hsp70 family protein [Dactylosporangium sp. NBC_01737]|uniref:Hsp70 family protein n=1 Tax=Dactylosporangium sp. NBC_01737 TaxID=2975959 RepID=UPI002E0E02BF|nr:Hsp70 family protein [Dactylosporangium sp. NBC_01737]
MAAGPRLGIDFGTSHTVALLAWPDGRVRPLLFDGSPLLPSCVYAQPDGQVLVGRDAVHAARVDPARFEASPKRRIDDGTVLLGDREFTVPALIGAVLSHVASEARRVAGGQVGAVTLTHPAAWGVSRRLALVEGATIAGLPQPALMPEPVAAAHYFAGVLQKPLTAEQGLLVYDFGGGTFDASVVTRAGEGFDVRAVDGIDDLGGIDLDALIVDYAKRKLEDPPVWARLESPQTTEDRRHRRLLWDDARVAKEMLSRTPSTGLHVPIAAADVDVTREAFEDLARPMLEQTVRTTAAVVRWAGLDNSKLAGLFLVGGSSRIPMVATLLQKELGVAPTIIEQPEMVVAEGSLRAWVNVGVPPGDGQQHAVPAAGQGQPGGGQPGGGQPGGGQPGGGQAGGGQAGAFAAGAAAAGAAGAVYGAGGPAAAAGAQGIPAGQVAQAAAFQQGTGTPPGGVAPVSAVPMSAPPVSSPPMSGPPMSSPPMSGPPMSGPPMSGPPMSAPPMGGHQMGGQPMSAPPASNAPVSAPPPVSGGPGYPAGAPVSPGFGDAEATQRIRPMTPPAGPQAHRGAPQAGHQQAYQQGHAPVQPPQPPRFVPPPQQLPPQQPAYVSPSLTPMNYAPPIPREEPLPPPAPRRSVAIPFLVGILVLALALAGYVVYKEVGNKTDNTAGQDPSTSTTTASGPTPTSTSQVLEIPARPREDRPSWLPSNWKLFQQRGLHELWVTQDESEGGRCDATDSALHVVTDRQGLTGCTLKDPLNVSMADVGIEAKVHRESGCAGIWARTGDKGYTVGVCDGVVRLHALGDFAPSQDNELASWPVKVTGDPYVALVVISNEVSVYVNGTKLGTKTHDLIRRGRVNLGAFTPGDPADVTFSEVRVWQPPSSSGGGNPTTAPSPSKTTSTSPTATPSWKPTSTRSST